MQYDNTQRSARQIGERVYQPRKKSQALQLRGKVAANRGRLAEDMVAKRYQDCGYELIAQRWRGKGGEIDLICRKRECFVFIEVKASKNHARAAQSIRQSQIDRICLAACEFCGDQPQGLLSEMRFDAALVDSLGRLEVLENVFAA